MAVQLGIIGGGVMGEAILSRLLSGGIYSPQSICVSDPLASRREFLAQTYGVSVTDRNAEVADSEILLLAIKPQHLAAVAAALPDAGAGLVVSILAGVTLAQLEAAFPGKAIVRAMPNTPAQVGAGVTALAPNAAVTATQREVARRLFAAVGTAIELPEPLMNAVTGLSGSGPGYVAVMVEALADGGVAAGLPRAVALELAIQTLYGTAKLLQETSCHPAVLKDRVASPGGTTMAGLAQLERSGVRAALIDAVLAATHRANELGEERSS